VCKHCNNQNIRSQKENLPSLSLIKELSAILSFNAKIIPPINKNHFLIQKFSRIRIKNILKTYYLIGKHFTKNKIKTITKLKILINKKTGKKY
jgi:hypothetical protein